MKKILATLLLVTLLVPNFTQAAQPTARTIIRQELRDVLVQSTENMGAVVDFSGQYSLIYADKTRGTNRFEMQVKSDSTTYPVTGAFSNSQSSISVPKVIAESRNSGENVSITDLFSVDTRFFPVEKELYFKLNGIAPEVQAQLVAFGIDVSPILGKWIKFGADDLGQPSADLSNPTELGLNSFLDQETTLRLKAAYLAAELKNGPILSVVNSGKITKNDVGESIQSVRVTVNPRWYSTIEAWMVAEAQKSQPDMTRAELKTLRQQIKTQMADLKKYLAKTTISLTVNLTQAKITTFAVSYKDSSPSYTYDYKTVKGKFVSKKVLEGRKNIVFSVKADLKKVAVDEILRKPDVSLSEDEVKALLFPEDTTTTTTSTLGTTL